MHWSNCEICGRKRNRGDHTTCSAARREKYKDGPVNDALTVIKRRKPK